MVTMFAAFAGLAFKKEHDITLRTGETFRARDAWGHDWTFTSQGVSQYKALNRYVTAVGLDATRDGQARGRHRQREAPARRQPRPAHLRALDRGRHPRDGAAGHYVVLAGVTGTDQAELRITFNPLVVWVWFGGMVMGLGG
jgi:cytochrome c-type biogenesis protein CcmF